MKPTPYDLLKAFLYAENFSRETSGLPDEAYFQIRAFVKAREKISDAGCVWRSGREVYEALERAEAQASRSKTA